MGKVRMDKKTMMSLFIILVMVGSIIGYAVIFVGGKDEQAPAATQVETPTTINFTAEDVDANVVQMFSSMLLLASTGETDIGIIDLEVRGIDGVRRINSRYNLAGGESLQGTLVYVAEISFAPERSAAEIYGEISSKATTLTGIEAHPLGLVALPKTLELKNAGLGLTKKHEFENPLVQAYLSIDTIAGDQILVSVNTDFAAQVISKISVLETRNLTASPQIVMLAGSFPLSSLKPELSLDANTAISRLPDANSLEAEIASLHWVESAKLEIPEPEPLTVNFDGNYSLLEPDINSALSAIPGITGIDFMLESGTMRIAYGQDAELPALAGEISSKLSALGLKFKEIELPEFRFSGRVSISPVSSLPPSEIAAEIYSLLSSKGIDSEILQAAVVDTNSISDGQGNEYQVEGGSFEAFVKPGSDYSPGRTARLNLFFIKIRNLATSISAYEAEEEETTDIPEPTVEAGYSRDSPAPMNTTLKTTIGGLLQTAEVEVTPKRIVRGDEALLMIKEANMFNDEPMEGKEYLLAWVTFKVIKTFDGEEYRVSTYQFDVVSESGIVYDSPLVAGPDPLLAGDLYPGASYEGWLVFAVFENDPKPLMAFERKDDGALWFKLY